ncbi:hypothetical protein M9H77_16951 [Catharanthus roseus]|uniref:Uncharacterized protein n=1 Tax=Catharanthus roseus TaxID=4058 RepID=A0ACC0B384_CATRO|nr:hypothetical protein M9H77_16951 [Catharanthus roseus]
MACNGAMCNQQWLSDGLFAKAHFYPPSFASDHSPCIYNRGEIHSSWELSNSLSLKKKDYAHISSRAEAARKELKQQHAPRLPYEPVIRNFITSLTKMNGSLTTSKEEIQEEFLSFYVGLLGTKQDSHGFHDVVIEDGPRVTPNQVNLLVDGYGPLLDKVAKTLLEWSSLNLSYARKLEVISFVVKGIEAFWLRILPISASNEEDLPHLFFACSFIADVWNNIKRWAGLRRSMTTIRSSLKWLMKESRGSSWICN